MGYNVCLALMLFILKVFESQDVWLVEFYSGRCGSCQEFAPVWESIEATVQTIRLGKSRQNMSFSHNSNRIVLPHFPLGKLDIDVDANMKLADALGVLEEGLPNIQLFTSKHGRNAIMTGKVFVSN